MKLAIIDLDGCVANPEKRFAKAEEAKQAFVTQKTAENIDRFQSTQVGWSAETVEKQATSLFWREVFDPEQVPTDTLVDGAVDDLATLAFNGYDVLLLTSRWTFELNETAKAQEMCDSINSRTEEENAWWNKSARIVAEAEEAYQNRFETPLPAPEVIPVPQAEIIIEGQNEVGSIIEFRGDRWLVTLCEYNSGLDPVDDEDPEPLSIGWHSWLVKAQPGNKALEVVAELLKRGEAALTDPDSVKFPDEQYASRLSDLAYDSEIGLYDRRKIK